MSLPLTGSGLDTQVLPDRVALGEAAGRRAAALLRTALDTQEQVRVAFAAAPSQDATLAALIAQPDLDWSRVVGFQLDDYVGLRPGAVGTFAHYLAEHLFDRVQIGTVQRMALAGDADAERDRYAALVAERPLDLVLLGIGENGHLAFNDPPAALRDDPQAARLVDLDHASRVQQVNDGCFETLELVPTRALTLTLPTILGARHLVCSVPGPRKRDAVEQTLLGPIGPHCPASYLREQASASIFLDTDSAPEGLS